MVKKYNYFFFFFFENETLFRCKPRSWIWTFNPWTHIEVHYMEKNPGIVSSKTLIYFPLKKERHEHLG